MCRYNLSVASLHVRIISTDPSNLNSSGGPLCWQWYKTLTKANQNNLDDLAILQIWGNVLVNWYKDFTFGPLRKNKIWILWCKACLAGHDSSNQHQTCRCAAAVQHCSEVAVALWGFWHLMDSCSCELVDQFLHLCTADFLNLEAKTSAKMFPYFLTSES